MESDKNIYYLVNTVIQDRKPEIFVLCAVDHTKHFVEPNRNYWSSRLDNPEIKYFGTLELAKKAKRMQNCLGISIQFISIKELDD